MADRNVEQDSLFKEIDEDLRQQKYAEIWKKYGKFIIGTSIALILGVASVKGWEAYDQNQKVTDSNQISTALKAINEANQDNAITILDNVIKNGSTGYAILARFNQAAILIKEGKRKQAVENYLSIASDTRIEKDLRDLALIMSAQLGLGHEDSDKFLIKLKMLIDGKNAWRHSAKELAALFAKESDDKTKALQLFTELADDATAPSNIRSRASEMSKILSIK
jgi:hypothetical protein